MNEIVICEKQDLVNVADAVRSKTGSNEEMSLKEIATKVSEISNSGTGIELPTLTNEGTASNLLKNKQLINSSGNIVTGTMANNGAINKTFDGINTKSYTVPAGYTSGGTVSLDNTIDNEVDTQSDLINQIKSVIDELPEVDNSQVDTVEQAIPSITVSSSGLITASSTQVEGYVAAGTKSTTKQLTTQAAQTITPSTSNKTIASGRYLTGTQTIKGDSNLVASNIKSGVSIFGVTGNYEGNNSGSGGNTFPYNITVTDNLGLSNAASFFYDNTNMEVIVSIGSALGSGKYSITGGIVYDDFCTSNYSYYCINSITDNVVLTLTFSI